MSPSPREVARRLRQLNAALGMVDERLQVLEVVESIRESRGESATRERDEAARLNARRVRLLARKLHYESYTPRLAHPQDFPDSPAPRFAYYGDDPTANTAIRNLSRKKKKR